MAELGLFDVTVFRDNSASDTRQVPATSISVQVYKEGAWANGSGSIADAASGTITVRDIGSLTTSSPNNSIQIGTTSSVTGTITATTATTLTVTANGGTLSWSDEDRVVNIGALTLYKDDQSAETKTNALTTDGTTGRAWAYVDEGSVDYIISGAGVTTTLISDVSVMSPNDFLSNVVDSATAVAFNFETRRTLSTTSGTDIAGGAKLFKLSNNGTEKLSVDWDGRLRLQASDLNIAAGGTRVGITAKMVTPASPGADDDIGIVGYIGVPGSTTIGANRIAAGLSGSGVAVSGATITGSLLGVEGGVSIGGAHTSNAIFGVKGNVGGDGTETGTLTNAYAIFGDPNQSAFTGITVTNVYGVWAGMPLAGTNRYALWSDGTTKINGRLDFGTTAGGFTSSTNVLVMGASGVSSPEFQLHGSATLTETTIGIKQIASQTGNLITARDSGNVIVGGIAPGGPIFTYVKAGVISDADFTTAPPSGSIAVDTTNSDLYVRVGGTWKKVAVA